MCFEHSGGKRKYLLFSSYFCTINYSNAIVQTLINAGTSIQATQAIIV